MILHGFKRDEFAHPTRAAFEAVISLEVRLAMMCAYVAADTSLRDSYLPHIKSLSSRVFKMYKKRHELAHFMIVGREGKNGKRTLIRPFFTVDAYSQKKGSELDAEQIAERAHNFEALAQRIKRHVQHVGALKKLPPKHYVQAGDKAFPPLGEEDLNPGL